jgi:hypothetical protein
LQSVIQLFLDVYLNTPHRQCVRLNAPPGSSLGHLMAKLVGPEIPPANSRHSDLESRLFVPS